MSRSKAMIETGTGEAFESMRADYTAAKTGRFRRRRTGIQLTGSGADYHYRIESDFLKVMEYARDMERNDAIAGPLVNQAVGNIVQNGLSPDPKTGDPGADQLLKDRWAEWSSDARQCSLDGELVYRDIEKMALRRMFVDGDILGVLTEEGMIQAVEAHRCRTPKTTRNVVHGVLLDDNRRRLQYWFTKDDVDPLSLAKIAVGDVEQVPAFDTDEMTGKEYRTVLHLRNPYRFSQTRGITAFAPIFDFMGMHEDLQFSKLVQQQIVSCVAIIRERSAEFQGGTTTPYGPQVVDALSRIVEQLAPGMEIRGLPGETIKPFSPNIPNAEFFQQMRTILQLIGANLGIPLVLLLMDASDTNFSGWRGAMDAARMGFRDMQQTLIDHWECPIYLWKVRQWAREDAGLRKLLAKNAATEDGSGKTVRVPRLFMHEWHAPRWPYVQPLQDAQADELRQRKLLTSPRRIHLQLNQDFDDVITETVEDNSKAIKAAVTEAKAIFKETGERVTWREVLFLTDAEMLKAVTTSVAMPPSGGAAAKETGPQPLNGAQITSAVDVIGKLRAGTMAPEAAIELLAGMGIDRTRAEVMVGASKPGAGASPEDKQYVRDLLKAFAANANTLPLLLNALDLQPMIAEASLPANKEYKEPYLPVLAPVGVPVSGDVVKDPEGDIVGGATVGSPLPGNGGGTGGQDGAGDAVGAGGGNKDDVEGQDGGAPKAPPGEAEGGEEDGNETPQGGGTVPAAAPEEKKKPADPAPNDDAKTDPADPEDTPDQEDA